MRRAIGWRDHVLGAALCVGYVAVLLGGEGDLGMSRDESFYVIAAQDYARWMKQFWASPGEAVSAEAIDAGWRYNHEHPGLAKALFGLSWLAHEAWKVDGEGGLFATDSAAFRFPGMLSAGLLLWLLYVFGARVFGRTAGAFAAVAYALTPRPFYHAHLDCFDVPIATAITFAIYAYWRALTNRRWIVVAGLAWGIALAIKHNSWITPGVFAIHFVWMVVAVRGMRRRGELPSQPGARATAPAENASTDPAPTASTDATPTDAAPTQASERASPETDAAPTQASERASPETDAAPTQASSESASPEAASTDAEAPAQAPPERASTASASADTAPAIDRRDVPITRPWWLLALLVLGPPILIATWPWVWRPETMLDRLGWYAGFHLNHEYYNMAYFGTTYFRPPFPISYPFVMTAFTVPLTTLALAAMGLGWRARALLPRWVRTRLWPKGAVEPDPAHTDLLLVGSLLAPLVVIALPSSPIFGGTKHWFPAYPFLCLYAGYAFARVATRFRHGLGARLPAARWSARLLVTAVALAPLIVQTRHTHPFGLSQYTPLAGGAPGAADLGMNRQFWGFTTRSLTPFFQEVMPNGGTVYLCDTTSTAWEMLHRDGHLPRNIRWAWSIPEADYVMVHHEHHFAEVEYQAWVAFGTTQPIHVLTYDGVPIVTVYENPRAAARRLAEEAR